MIYIDKCAYTNNLSNVHPLEKILFVVFTMVICLTSTNGIIPIIIILFISFLTVFKAGIPMLFYWRLLLVPLTFLLLSIISIIINILPSQEIAIVRFNAFGLYFGITEYSLQHGYLLFIKSMGAVSCLYFLSLTTPLVDIVSVLRKLKLPEIYLELMTLIYRVIFILIGIVGRIYTSQSSRLGYSTLKNQYRSLSQLVTCLFRLSYAKTCKLFVALECRCYTGKLRVLEKNYKISVLNFVYIVIFESALIFIGIITQKGL